VAYRLLVFTFFFSLAVLIYTPEIAAQKTSGYTLKFAPDAWYNDVDGVRAGLRFRGETQGSFDGGPHRLDGGLWLATWIPEYPVSYFLNFTEPIPALSEIAAESSMGVKSSISTGYSSHLIQFQKRWQPGINEFVNRKFTAGFAQEKLFEDKYRPFPGLWQNEWKSMLHASFVLNGKNGSGNYQLATAFIQNVNNDAGKFAQWTGELQYKTGDSKKFNLSGRIFATLSGDDTAPEMLYTSSMSPAIHWLESGLTRAKGTIPDPWLDAGSIQVAGGANIRGYLNRDIEALNRGENPLFTHVAALNLELGYPNPINRYLKNMRIIGDLINFKSYTFFDGGIFKSEMNAPASINFDDTQERFNGGLGFMLSLNIPDFLGRPRGFILRYELPLWLSDPENGNNKIKFRQLVGLGAVISL